MAIDVMTIDRRNFLIGAALAIGASSRAFAGVLPREDAADAEPGDFIAACRRPDNTYSVVVLRLDGSVLRELPLKDRGHDIALDPASGQAVVFARRPGSFALAFDVQGRREPVLFTTPAKRHFYGHGVFSPDGRLLYATEHDNDTRAGLLGVYSATQGYKRIGEMQTFGIGPHEVILLADGRTLAVANGGIETHVEPQIGPQIGAHIGNGREKLNVDTMMPSLAFIDSATGDLIAQHDQASDLHKLSIRHIAADARGAVWFGAQWEGDAADTPELIGFAGIDKPLRIIEPDTPRGAALAGYIGAVAISGDKRVLAASAPRAGRVVYVDTESAAVIGETPLTDGCGLTGIAQSEFALSSGLGVVQTEAPDHTHLRTASFPGRSFDNHLRLVG
jgi:hypothetical protein